jgi:hypothetical protein
MVVQSTIAGHGALSLQALNAVESISIVSALVAIGIWIVAGYIADKVFPMNYPNRRFPKTPSSKDEHPGFHGNE